MAMSLSEQHVAQLMRRGIWVIVCGILPIGIWMCVAQLATAVVAPAVVKVDLNRRLVQHVEGGMVKEVLVRDGQHVSMGDPIVVLADVRVDADRNRLQYRVHAEQAAVYRLEAEQTHRTSIKFSEGLLSSARSDPRVRESLSKETALFQSRRQTLQSHLALLATQRGKVLDEISAVKAQIQKAQKSLAFQRNEIETNRGLLRDGYISVARIAQMEAALADYDAKLEERRTELTRADQRLVDIDLRIESLQNEYTKVASDELKVATTRLSEIEQESRKSDDAAHRQVVVAPASGEVIDLRFKTPGMVVGPREPIAEIVPKDAKLVIESRVRPEDFAELRSGQIAKIRLTGIKLQSAPLIDGRITYVAGDRLVDKQTGEAYYSVLISVEPEIIAKTSPNLALHAGMPAEVYIQGGAMTPLDYLIEPISTTIRRAGRPI